LFVGLLFAVELVVSLIACVGVTGLDVTRRISLFDPAARLGLRAFTLRVGGGRRRRGCRVDSQDTTHADGDDGRNCQDGEPLFQIHFKVSSSEINGFPPLYQQVTDRFSTADKATPRLRLEDF
jgi:hypothetical protein